MLRRRIAAALARVYRSPLFWILLIAALLRLPGLFWGLPGSDGWDDDGVAPRNFLVGLAQTYALGTHFTYPPLHMILLAVLTLPGWMAALLHAHSHTPHGVISEMIRVPYMTFFSVIARLVSIAMSLATIFFVGRMAELVAGKRAGWFAAAALAFNAAFTYYGQVSNLDGPYIFWSALSLLAWMRLIALRDLKQMRNGMLAAAAAIATKDQAYAVFVVAIPAMLALWFAQDRWARQHAGVLLFTLLKWGTVSLVALLLVDGAISNPSGFADRIAFLTGPASRDYAEYARDWAGWLRMLEDTATTFTRFCPLPIVLLAGYGLALVVRRPDCEAQITVAGLLPLLAAISFTLAFDMVALRSEVRFFLPQSVFLAVYAGLGADKLASLAKPFARTAAHVSLMGVALVGLYGCTGIDAALADDPRYDAEQWMQEHVPAGSHIETYGLNAYLPRFPKGAIVTRLDVKPARLRNPLANVTDVDQPFGTVVSRHPQFLVVAGFWVHGYLVDPKAAAKGRAVARVAATQAAEAEPRAFFRKLYGQELPYRLAHRSQYNPWFWPSIRGYETLGQEIDIFKPIAPCTVGARTAKGEVSRILWPRTH